MTDKPKRPKPCPLCGTKASVTRLPFSDGGGVWNIWCRSDACGLVLYGGDNEPRWQVIKKWNRRHMMLVAEMQNANACLIAACKAARKSLCGDGGEGCPLDRQIQAAIRKAEPTT